MRDRRESARDKVIYGGVAEIDERGATRECIVRNISDKGASVEFSNVVNLPREQMSLRGVGSNSLDQGVDQSVSLNIDGLQLTHGLAFRAASFDLAQVEVLKGPQALYFGGDPLAGAKVDAAVAECIAQHAAT